eukprot:SAG11_NODE_7979_length_1074_cov_2.200000_2_plen_147_part_00
MLLGRRPHWLANRMVKRYSLCMGLLLGATAADAAPAAAALVEYEHKYCLTEPKPNDFIHVDSGSLDGCAATCAKMGCACFDYSTRVWAKGKCRIVPKGARFSLGQSCSDGDCEMAFVPGGVPGIPGVPPHAPPPPPGPAPPPDGKW